MTDEQAARELEAMRKFAAGEIPSWDLLSCLKAGHPDVRCWADAVVMLAEAGFWPPALWKMHPDEQAQVDNFLDLMGWMPKDEDNGDD